MHAEIIAVGDEITSGQLLDSNSQWLSLHLEEMGIRVLYHSTVGDELAPAMAVGCRRRFAADYGLAVGRFPSTESDASPPPRVFVALASPDGVEVKRFPHAGHPAILKTLCAKRALNLARLSLLGRLT
ncbi:MAG: CinA family protein [Candidatus Nealsonbacteria bacterium]|nr:CinA family protein [Candidatus Nealsonbacteria bacterium]